MVRTHTPALPGLGARRRSKPMAGPACCPLPSQTPHPTGHGWRRPPL